MERNTDAASGPLLATKKKCRHKAASPLRCPQRAAATTAALLWTPPIHHLGSLHPIIPLTEQLWALSALPRIKGRSKLKKTVFCLKKNTLNNCRLLTTEHKVSDGGNQKDSQDHPEPM